jgi:addiction module RelE/StbE family toxin
MATLIWAPRALGDLEDLIEFISRNAPMTARRFAQKIVARVDLLEHHPLMGGYVLEDDTRSYREILQGNYRIIYRVDGERVIIVAVHHSAKLLDTKDLG